MDTDPFSVNLEYTGSTTPVRRREEVRRGEVVSGLKIMKGRDGVIGDSVVAGTQGKKG